MLFGHYGWLPAFSGERLRRQLENSSVSRIPPRDLDVVFHTFKQFQAIYPDDAACLRKLMEVNYGGTEITCPGCGADSKFHPLANRRAFVCQWCGHHVYPAAGTIFHKSRTNLTKWFFAMYLMTSTRHGVAAKEVERQLGVTYKCAWRMCHELRKLMASADFGGPLGGDGKHTANTISLAASELSDIPSDH